MGNFDSFTIAVLGSAVAVILGFFLMMVLDKGKRATPPAMVLDKGKRATPPANPPAKVAGKR